MQPEPAPAGLSWHRLPEGAASWTSVGCLLGSFDPLHRGHEHLVEALRDHAEGVVLLVPAVHFEKRIVPGDNATLDQRLAMLERRYAGAGSNVAIGLAQEVLFVRLHQVLKQCFPGAAVRFAMGDESLNRLLDSPAYFRRLGLGFGRHDRERVERIAAQALVHGRTSPDGVGLPVPNELRRLSSTRVRAIARELHRCQAPEIRWRDELAPLVAPEILDCIRSFRLYAGDSHPRLPATPGAGTVFAWPRARLPRPPRRRSCSTTAGRR